MCPSSAVYTFHSFGKLDGITALKSQHITKIQNLKQLLNISSFPPIIKRYFIQMPIAQTLQIRCLFSCRKRQTTEQSSTFDKGNFCFQERTAASTTVLAAASFFSTDHTIDTTCSFVRTSHTCIPTRFQTKNVRIRQRKLIGVHHMFLTINHRPLLG